MEYVYIMACQRGQAAHEIHSMWDTYEKAIKEYYEYHIRDDKESSFSRSRQDDDDYWFMYLYKFPVNKIFANNKGWSETKLGKSSKYRIKFKNWGELRKEYVVVSRDSKIESIIGD